MLRNILFTAAALTVLNALSIAQIPHYSCPLSGTWDNNDWHRIYGECTIENNNTLRIEPGVRVDFQEYQGEAPCIVVEGGGRLNAGTAGGQPVIFTSCEDPPGGGGNPAPGDWKALIADGTSQNDAIMTLTNCEIRYGGEPWAGFTDPDGVVRATDHCEVVVDSCYIHHNRGPGISTTHDATALVEITKNTIANCDYGIKISSPDGDCYVLNNFVKACSTAAMIHGGENVQFGNNLFVKNLSHGVYSESAIESFVNNVIDSTGADCHGLYFVFNVSGSDLRNNIFTRCDSLCVKIGEGTANLNFCCFYDYGVGICNSANYTGCITQDPRFVSDYGDDNYYHLLWNSPCIEAGDPTLSNSNPAADTSDIGAYGGPDADPYFVGITGGNVSGTLDEDGSPYHILADFTVGYQSEIPLTLDAGTADDVDCEFLFTESDLLE
jgi:hypothetical protein